MSFIKILKTLMAAASLLCLFFAFSLLAGCNEKAEVIEQTEKEITEEPSTDEKEAVEETVEEEEAVEEEAEAEEAVYEVTFFSNHGSPFSVFTCMPDGSNIEKIYECGSDIYYPCWNGEHTKIAFSSAIDSDESDIFIYDFTAEELTKLVEKEGGDTVPSFSPDGKSVVFSGTVAGTENRDIFTVNTDGSDLKNLTNGETFNSYPHYSPDGDTILFSSKRDGTIGLFTMDLDGSNIEKLSGDDSSDLQGSYSPDGSSIVFVSRRSGNHEDIWIMNADGTGEAKQLTDDQGLDMYPSYSPDGTMIAFESDRDDMQFMFYDIFIMTSEGENEINITPDLKGTHQGGATW